MRYYFKEIDKTNGSVDYYYTELKPYTHSKNIIRCHRQDGSEYAQYRSHVDEAIMYHFANVNRITDLYLITEDEYLLGSVK